MNKFILIAAAVVSTAAFAQADLGAYNRALSAFNSGNYDDATASFFELQQSTTDEEIRSKSDYYFAQSLAKKNLPFSALIQYSAIMGAGPKHPYYLKAVEGMVNMQNALDDQDLAPFALNNAWNDQEFATLPQETINRIQYLIGVAGYRKAKFDEAKDFLEAVTKESAIYAKAQYLLGLVLSDRRFPGGPKNEEGIKAFERVIALTGTTYEDLTRTKQLSTIGIGRVNYGMGNYEKSSEAYESIPRFSRYWDQALFENGFSRFQGDDFGGALGSLQALHAPQFAGAFQPESWILKSTIYYFSCLYEESKTALAAFNEIYLPMAEKLRPHFEGDPKDFEYYFKLVGSKNETETIPQPVYLWVRNSEALRTTLSLLSQIEVEKQVFSENSAWRASKMPKDQINGLDQNKATLVRLAGQKAKNRLKEAMDSIKLFDDQAEIIRFETAKAEKELAEAGIDQQKLLQGKPLFRPKMPAENWNYWKFQGEFWRDEIGYYQYTLKRGCPATVGE